MSVTNSKLIPLPRLGVVILAAGSSTRMGTSKALLPWGSGPIIAHIAGTLLSVKTIRPVIVVTGQQAEQVAAALAGLDVACVYNPDYAVGEMLSSVRAGMAAMFGLYREVDSIMLVLGDQPAVRAETLQTLVTHWQQRDEPLIIPTYQGRRGHPLIFATALVPDILALGPPETLRDFVHRNLHWAEQFDIDDPAVIGDIDTPEDYRRALVKWEQEQRGE